VYRAQGNALDGVGGNNGTLAGGVSYAPGVVGQSFSFNGQGSYVDLGTGPDVVGTGAFAVAVWIKTTAAGGMILNQRDANNFNGEYALALSGGKVSWSTYGNNQFGFAFTSNASVNDGNWHLIVAQRLANGTGQIYIDGVLDSSQTVAPVPLGSGFHVYLGEDVRNAVDVGPAYANNFIGQIDEVQFYSGSLTLPQIQYLQSSPAAQTLVTTDQRGDPRRVGGALDIGAAEYQYDLAITGTAPANATAGGPVNYTLSVTNNGPDSVAAVTITDVLPATVGFVSVMAPTGWTVSAPAVGQTGTVIFTYAGTLAAGTTANFTINTTAATTGTSGLVLVNTATVGPAGFDTAAGNNSVSSHTTWSPGPPAGVDIHGQPSNTVAGKAISPAITVAVVDQYGNTVTTNNTQLVTLSIYSGPRGARLGGTITVRAVNGVATFTNLTLNVAGTYVLEATGGRLDPDYSNPFTVSPAEVTDGLRIRRGSPHPVGHEEHHHEGGELFSQTITITNTSGHALLGPLALVLENLPAGVTLANASGRYQGNPYINVLRDGEVLEPGQSVTITLDFWVRGRLLDEGEAFDYNLDALLGI
jgi:uncharacterized repeat protein (TIGR01451 family)